MPLPYGEADDGAERLVADWMKAITRTSEIAISLFEGPCATQLCYPAKLESRSLPQEPQILSPSCRSLEQERHFAILVGAEFERLALNAREADMSTSASDLVGSDCSNSIHPARDDQITPTTHIKPAKIVHPGEGGQTPKEH
jgi:hypothetical protein